MRRGTLSKLFFHFLPRAYKSLYLRPSVKVFSFLHKVSVTQGPGTNLDSFWPVAQANAFVATKHIVYTTVREDENTSRRNHEFDGD